MTSSTSDAAVSSSMTSDETSLTFGSVAISPSTTYDATSISCCTSSTNRLSLAWKVWRAKSNRIWMGYHPFHSHEEMSWNVYAIQSWNYLKTQRNQQSQCCQPQTTSHIPYPCLVTSMMTILFNLHGQHVHHCSICYTNSIISRFKLAFSCYHIIATKQSTRKEMCRHERYTEVYS